MERAAAACFQWLVNNNHTQQIFHIFCGKGNNGGDGLALARILIQSHVRVTVYILETGKPGSADFQENLQKLHLLTSNITFIQSESVTLNCHPSDILIDSIFGTGLNKPLSGLGAWLVEKINRSAAKVISIDLPSGIFADRSAKGMPHITATHTLSFGNYKKAFLMPENADAVGELHLLDIGLSERFETAERSDSEMPDFVMVQQLQKPRKKFSHKGDFGHAMLLAGSYGMMGAAVLAARGCLAAGTGKLTCLLPGACMEVMQVSLPEAICGIADNGDMSFEAYSAIGAGPGMGKTSSAKSMLTRLFSSSTSPLLLDADALNIMSEDQTLLEQLPKGSVITPHVKEFERLFGPSTNDFDRLDLAVEKARQYNIYIVLKGHHTAIITPMGRIYFNNTGNAGMAKGGMGDVLSGIITGLLAQKYPLPEATILGVYLHGLAGDIAAGMFSQQAMQATDLINCLPEAWKKLDLNL